MFKNTKNKDHDNYDEHNEDESENLSDVEYSPPNSSQDDNDDSYDSENELDCYDPEMKNYQFDKIKVKLLRGENKEPVFLKEGGGLRYIYYNQDDGFDDVFRRISKLYFPSIFILDFCSCF
jgi:hypothetical protein